MAKGKVRQAIRVLLIEDAAKSSRPLRPLFSERQAKGFKVAVADTIPAIRKKIAANEIDCIVVGLAPDDERLWPIQEIFRRKPALPVIVIAETKRPRANYPFPVYGTLARADLDSFLLAQVIRTAAASGGVKHEFNRSIKEFQSSGVRFLNVILSNADGIAVVDKRGCILFINPAARDMLGGEVEVRRSRFPWSGRDCTQAARGARRGR